MPISSLSFPILLVNLYLLNKAIGPKSTNHMRLTLTYRLPSAQ